jgi:uncharacterized membrane protein YedE/YeeE
MLESALLSPWPWFVTGPLIGLTVPLLYLLGGKGLGISSSFRHMCSIALPKTRIPFLRDNDWRKDSWNLLFVAGIALGGFLGVHLLSSEPPDLLPDMTAGWTGFAQILAGGFLVGFGSRYAGGCTSGHAITGLSTLQKASLVSVLSFFAGGLAAAGIYVLFSGEGVVAWVR